MKVAILHDHVPEGAPEDQADALVQVEAVAAALARLGHTCSKLPVTLDLQAVTAALRNSAPDMVFNLVESVGGHGRLIHLVPAVLDALGLRYTGARTTAVFLTTHKLLAKRELVGRGIPTPPWFEPDSSSPEPLRLPDRCMVKPVWEDASVGIDDDAVLTCRDLAELRRHLLARGRKAAGGLFAEQYIEGRELNLSLLACDGQPEVLPPAEIVFVDYPPDKPRIVGYAAKWDTSSFEYHATPRQFDFSDDDAGLLERLSGLAMECWRLFDLSGYARVDFRVDSAGHPWVLEINANPCLSPDAGFMAAATRAGLTPEQVVSRIITDALERSGQLER